MTIHIALSCDQNYAPYARVTLSSILRSSRCPASFHFHFLNAGVSATALQGFQALVESHGSGFSTYELDDGLFSGAPVLRYGPAVYHRINLPDYLPDAVGRVIYIDTDTLVLDDLATLWEIPMEGHPVAAVENLSPHAHQDIGLARDQYFNSGVMMMDLEAWRNTGLHHQIIQYVQSHAESLRFVDQCSLNAVLAGDWKRLPVRWNMQSDIYKAAQKYAQGCSYPVAELAEACREPAVVHFTGKHKPWKVICFHPFKRLYRSLLVQLVEPDWRPPDSGLATYIRYILAVRRHWKRWLRQRRLPRHIKRFQP